MTETSNDGALKKLLLKKAKEDQQQSRELVLSEQQKLLNDLNSKYNDALSTTLNDIQETLSSRLGGMALLTAQEAQTVEKMIEDHQRKLTDTLTSYHRKATKAIRAQTDPAAESLESLTANLKAISKEAERLEKSAKRRRVKNWTVALMAIIFIGSASWGLLHYLTSQIQQQLTTLQTLKSQTYGLNVIQTDSGTFLILPESSQMGYSVGGKRAIRLFQN